LTTAAAGTRKDGVARPENKTPYDTARWNELQKAWLAFFTPMGSLCASAA